MSVNSPSPLMKNPQRSSSAPAISISLLDLPARREARRFSTARPVLAKSGRPLSSASAPWMSCSDRPVVLKPLPPPACSSSMRRVMFAAFKSAIELLMSNIAASSSGASKSRSCAILHAERTRSAPADLDPQPARPVLHVIAGDVQRAGGMAGADGAGVEHVAKDRAGAAEGAAGIDESVRAGNRAIDFQKAAGDRRVAGVGVRIREDQRARADLGQRAAYIPGVTAVLDHAGKGRAQIVDAHGQVYSSEKDITAALDRADLHARNVARTDVQAAIAENRHARGAAGGILKEQNAA